MAPAEPALTWGGVARGAALAAALAPGILGAGVLYGALCRGQVVHGPEAALQSLLVAAGTLQFAVLDLWVRPVPLLPVIVLAVLVNGRFTLMGAALPGWYGDLPPGRRLLSAWFLTDETWAIAMREHDRGWADAGILVGCGVVAHAAWVLGTVVGYLTAESLGIETVPGLAFLVPAALVAVLAGFWGGVRENLVPWAAAGAVGVASATVLPGSWYVLLGGAAGMFVGARTDVA